MAQFKDSQAISLAIHMVGRLPHLLDAHHNDKIQRVSVTESNLLPMILFYFTDGTYESYSTGGFERYSLLNSGTA